jgi:hypothetical protein
VADGIVRRRVCKSARRSSVFCSAGHRLRSHRRPNERWSSRAIRWHLYVTFRPINSLERARNDRMAAISRTSPRYADAHPGNRARRRCRARPLVGRTRALACRQRSDAVAFPRRPLDRTLVSQLQIAARLAVWFIGGIALALGMRLTAVALVGSVRTSWAIWWVAGLAFIAIELVAQLALQMRGRPSFFNGRG